MLEKIKRALALRQTVNGLSIYEQLAVVGGVVLLLGCLGVLWRLGEIDVLEEGQMEKAAEVPYIEETPSLPLPQEEAAEAAVQQPEVQAAEDEKSGLGGEWVYDEVYRDWRYCHRH